MSDSDAEDTCQVAVVTVTSLVWQTYPGNTPLAGGKIFPGKKTYEDEHGTDRRKVKVRATLNMAPPASDLIYVRFQCWDVDDPSADSAPIDEDDNDPDPNKHSIDNRGSFNFEDSADILADGSRVVDAIFLVSMNPGDNYRITATTSQEANDDLTHYKVETGNLPSSVKRTPILTTWRKLWVELDSMEAVATSGGEDNWVRGGIDTGSLDYDPVADETKVALHQDLAPCWEETKQYHFVGGAFDASGSWPPVRTISHAGDDEIVVSGELTIGWPTPYDLSDDDNMSLLPDFPDTSKLNAIFADCYIVCDTDAPGGTNDVAFKRNLGGADTSSSDIMNAADRGSSPYEANDYWVVYALSIFQLGYTHDWDPDSDSGQAGGTEGYWQAAVIVLENIRDAAVHTPGVSATTLEQQTVVHEIGHQILESSAHTTGTIMDTYLPVPSAQEKFSDPDIAAIRSKTSSPGT